MTTEAFQQQAGELRKQLVSIAHKYMGNTDEAEDIAQDAMVKLWLMREQLTLPIAGMASIVTRNLCIDALRKKHQTIDIAQLPDEADFSDDGEQIEQLMKVIGDSFGIRIDRSGSSKNVKQSQKGSKKQTDSHICSSLYRSWYIDDCNTLCET